MATNLALDDRLLQEALKIGGRATKRETVNTDFLLCAVSVRHHMPLLTTDGHFPVMQR